MALIEAVFDLGNNIFPLQSCVLRRDVLPPRMFASPNGPHYTDFFMLLRLVEKYGIGLISRRIMKMRSHAEQASRQLAIDDSLDLRTHLFYDYCAELSERWPDRSEEIAGLRRRVGRARRSAALWIWVFAKDDRQAVESRVALAQSGTNRWLRLAMAAADRNWRMAGHSQASRSPKAAAGHRLRDRRQEPSLISASDRENQ